MAISDLGMQRVIFTHPHSGRSRLPPRDWLRGNLHVQSSEWEMNPVCLYKPVANPSASCEMRWQKKSDATGRFEWSGSHDCCPSSRLLGAWTAEKTSFGCMSGKISPQHLRYHLPNAGKQLLLSYMMFFNVWHVFFCSCHGVKIIPSPKERLSSAS